jgi:hypothetical protein
VEDVKLKTSTSKESENEKLKDPKKSKIKKLPNIKSDNRESESQNPKATTKLLAACRKGQTRP